MDGEADEGDSPQDLQNIVLEVSQENQVKTSSEIGFISKEEHHSSVVDAEDDYQCESEMDPRIYEELEISMEKPWEKSLTWREMGAAATSILLIAAIFSFLKSRSNS
ncbi:hypothetical protein ECG_04509 [Echinococcus granulosus]|nr:hypothetical protein ECG_04509 [Echinococcus granulosus]